MKEFNLNRIFLKETIENGKKYKLRDILRGNDLYELSEVFNICLFWRRTDEGYRYWFKVNGLWKKRVEKIKQRSMFW